MFCTYYIHGLPFNSSYSALGTRAIIFSTEAEAEAQETWTNSLEHRAGRLNLRTSNREATSLYMLFPCDLNVDLRRQLSGEAFSSPTPPSLLHSFSSSSTFLSSLLPLYFLLNSRGSHDFVI